MKKLSTVEKILATALKLFNENETLSITTNHIAKEARISPGNLYYHFKNKEEIIVKLYEQMSQTYSDSNSFELITIASNPIEQLHHNFEQLGKLFFAYRFLLRDIAVLVALYPKLKAAFVPNQEKRINQIKVILEFFVKEDILKNEVLHSIEKRAKLHWFVTSYWQSFAVTTSEVGLDSIHEAQTIFFEFLIYPNLTLKGKQLLDAFQG